LHAFSPAAASNIRRVSLSKPAANVQPKDHGDVTPQLPPGRNGGRLARESFDETDSAKLYPLTTPAAWTRLPRPNRAGWAACLRNLKTYEVEVRMNRLKIAGLGLVFAAFAFMSPAAARMKNMMFMVHPGGSMTALPMPDKKKIAEMIKEADPIGEDMVIMAWGGTFYTMKNHKMANGQMAFDYWGFHGTRAQ
jgi:hypothetical protein